MNVWSQYAGADSVCICMEHWCCRRRFPQLTQIVPLFCSLPWLDLLLPPAWPPAAMHLLMLGWAARPGLLDCSTRSDFSMKLTIWSHLWTDTSVRARWMTHPTSPIARLEACWQKLQAILTCLLFCGLFLLKIYQRNWAKMVSLILSCSLHIKCYVGEMKTLYVKKVKRII